eukprot:TRINITY_DN24919_c0_g1_i1.p1 TRINITY_DN24919_c0_g1~~TRINITY_DN24919_c0_g1_i1.p1  ORF type:complete len:860 (+),score=419.18 TRINITY_DN24919_c0_g1_i1:58-2580(+)
MPGKAAKKPGAKKGPSAAIAAMKAKREKELEEERLRKEEEAAEEARLEEEERKAAEEEAERERRKAEWKKKQEEEAKSGKPQLGAAKKKFEETKKKVEMMKKSGLKVPEAMLQKLAAEEAALAGDGAETAEEPAAAKPKTKAKTETLAQKKKRLEKEKAEREAAEAKQKEEQKKESGGDGDWEDEVDDWEDAADASPAHVKEPEQEPEPEEEKPKQLSKLEQEAETERLALARHADPMAGAKVGDLRSPICCILGHVDTGKTKLLDYIRRTNVQSGEAGGITQQIGASFFPAQALMDKTAKLRSQLKADLKVEVPGLLVIDTPGHEAFANLRGRGSALCDIAILVVDIMHGLEPQTRESIKLIKERRCPFVVALNKIDRLYDWKATKDAPFANTMAEQKDHVKAEFEQRLRHVTLELAELGMNAVVYNKNKDFLKNVSLVPTSAHTGEGVPDLLLLMAQLTQRHMSKKLTLSESLNCTVLEVKKIEGHGVTIDVILVDGVLREGDTIMVCGMNGPIVTQIRGLLTPPPLKEMRVKAEYILHKQIRAAQGIKISANDLEHAIPGTPLLVVRDGDNVEDLQEEVMKDLSGMMTRNQGDMGVAVQASTLGALEALLVFLKECEIPVSTVGVGEVNKKDVMRVVGIKEKNPKYAVMLCFDVNITKEANQVAEKEDIKIFTADIIYNLQDKFKAYLVKWAADQAERMKDIAVFPVHLKTMREHVFRVKDPIVLGMTVVDGQLRPGCPLFVWKKDEKGKRYPFKVGKVESAEKDHKVQKVCKKGDQVAVKIQSEGITFGRQVDVEDDMHSLISRESIDALKTSFREEMSKTDWGMIVKLKKELQIL